MSKKEDVLDVLDALEILRRKAQENPDVRQKLLSTAECPNPLQEFCRAAADLGAPMDEMDLVFAGEEDYAAIRRSTNGGGENSPLLEGSEGVERHYEGEDGYSCLRFAEAQRTATADRD